MFDFIKKHFIKKVKAFGIQPTTKDSVLESLAKGICPDCGNNEFLMGPQGGISQNIKCTKCGSEFNVAPFEDGKWCGVPFVAERIRTT